MISDVSSSGVQYVAPMNCLWQGSGIDWFDSDVCKGQRVRALSRKLGYSYYCYYHYYYYYYYYYCCYYCCYNYYYYYDYDYDYDYCDRACLQVAKWPNIDTTRRFALLYMYIYTYTYTHVSLSLSIYIYT